MPISSIENHKPQDPFSLQPGRCPSWQDSSRCWTLLPEPLHPSTPPGAAVGSACSGKLLLSYLPHTVGGTLFPAAPYSSVGPPTTLWFSLAASCCPTPGWPGPGLCRPPGLAFSGAGCFSVPLLPRGLDTGLWPGRSSPPSVAGVLRPQDAFPEALEPAPLPPLSLSAPVLLSCAGRFWRGDGCAALLQQ